VSLRILDLSANDGWMAANVSLLGHQVDGMDLNAEAITRANARKAEFPNLGRFVCDDLHRAPEHFEEHSYDAVVCFETLEHVPDPRATLAVMARMCRPGGRLYVSTPDGAYERGNVPGWHVVEHKGHLRAIRPSDLAGLLCEVGVVEGFMVGPDKVTVASVRPRPPRGKVVFFAGAGFVQPLPEKIWLEGLGGSETALCKMAEQFARRGWDVRVYAGEGDGGIRGDHVTTNEDADPTGNVLYRPAAAWDPGEACDLFVSSRVPEVLDRSIAAPRRVLWLHDADYGERLTEERVERATDVIVLSEFQQELLTGLYPFLEGRTWVSRNGIEPLWFRSGATDAAKKPQVVYSSSPDRGLEVLLELWPRVRERVPEATLHYGYAPVYFAMRDAGWPGLQELSTRLDKLGQQEGVVNHGSMGQQRLARLYMDSMVWAYPSWQTIVDGPFPEISCISAMEAQAAGCVPIALDHGALRETVKAGDLVAGDPRTEEWRERFVDAIVKALTDRKYRGRIASRGRLHGKTLGWEDVAEAWEERLLSGVRETVAV
jgi:glycosyltransferase involved in cell wall biosynthesis